MDRTGPFPRVLFGKRHDRLVFLPGLFVFPGGRVEAGDGRIPSTSPLRKTVESALMRQTSRPSTARARAIALAAIRELSEETGLLLGESGTWSRPPGADDWMPFFERGIVPALHSLTYVARAITPPGLPRRYDTRFFAVDAENVAARIDGLVHPDAELVELCWAGLDRENDHLPMLPITRVILRELAARIEAGLERDLPVPFFRTRGGAFLRDEI
ncbi:NUDIX hydrolase [Terrihabitans sp. B22-R8]|uniref:NUDIX hydrolase n=1 Tax=Terrihabitans sp. B22-R8 TaxID=3425128 RepID=UPI00403D1177